jgi:hypothetical protein
MQQNSHHSASSWLWQGLMFGLPLGLLQFLFWLLTLAIPVVSIGSVVHFFVVSLLALVGGLLAGLVTGSFAGMLFLLASFVYVTVQLYLTGHRVNPLSLLPAALFGLGGGVIGGAVGREEPNYRA